jgi:hypothetical protein
MIKRKYTSAWMTAVASFVVWANSLAHGQSQNRWVPNGSMNIGNVHQGELVERAFVVRNPGRSAANVRILALSHPGMNVRMPQNLGPGASGEIFVTWDTRLVQGDMTAQALLLFNDADTVLVGITAHVIPPIEILPYSAVFISGFRDEDVTRTLEIVNNDAAPLNVVGITRENPDSGQTYSATLTPIEPGRRYELVVALTGTATAGRSRDVLLLHTDHSRYPVIRVPVNLFVKNDVYINPESVDFGQITDETWGPETFLLNSRLRPIKVFSVTSSLTFLKVTEPAANAASSHEFKVEIGDTPAEGPFSGVIHISTDDPSFPMVDVPVEGELLR